MRLCARVYINLSLMGYGNFVYCRWLDFLIVMSLIQLVVIKNSSNHRNKKITYFLTCKCSFNTFGQCWPKLFSYYAASISNLPSKEFDSFSFLASLFFFFLQIQF